MRLADCCIAATALLGVGVAGCGPGDGRVAVSGTVSVDGQPVRSGSISFRPVDASKFSGGGGPIVDGKFALPADHGLQPAKYLITVMAMHLTGRTIEDPQRGEVAEYTPLKLLESGKLEIEISAANNAPLGIEMHRAARTK